MQSLTASLLSKNAINNNNPTKRVSNITYRLINECKELRLLISTLRSTISKNDSNLFTIRDFITANTTLLEHDIKTKDDEQLFIIARTYWLSFIRANDWCNPLVTSTNKRAKYVSCMHYMIKAIGMVGREVRKQGISLRTLAEKYLTINWTKATKRWCAIFTLLGDSPEQFVRYIYGVICEKVNLVLPQADRLAYMMIHSYVDTFWIVANRYINNPSSCLTKFTTKPIIDA